MPVLRYRCNQVGMRRDVKHVWAIHGLLHSVLVHGGQFGVFGEDFKLLEVFSRVSKTCTRKHSLHGKAWQSIKIKRKPQSCG